MYTKEGPIGNGVSTRIHQLNGTSNGATNSSKRRTQSFLLRSPSSSITTTTTVPTSTHNNNQPFSYINGNNGLHSERPSSNYYSLDRRPTTKPSYNNAVPTPTAKELIYTQVLPKDQRPKKQDSNRIHHQHVNSTTMTTTIGDDRHIHHYVYENPNKENHTKFTQADEAHRRQQPIHYHSNGNITKVFLNGDNDSSVHHNYSATTEEEEVDDDVLTPFSKRFSSTPKINGYYGHHDDGHNSSTTKSSSSYYNRYQNSSGAYPRGGNGNLVESSLASTSREASPSPPYYQKQPQHHQQQRFQSSATRLVRDADKQREYTAPSAKLVSTYMNRNGDYEDDDEDDYEVTKPMPIINERNYHHNNHSQHQHQFVVQNRRRKTSDELDNYSNNVNNNNSHYDYNHVGLGNRKNTAVSATNGVKNGPNSNITNTTTVYKSSITPIKMAPLETQEERGVLKTSTIRKLTSPTYTTSNGKSKSESLLAPERTPIAGPGKKPGKTPGSGFMSTLMRNNKNKSVSAGGGTMTKSNGHGTSTINSTTTSTSATKTKTNNTGKHRGNIFAILLSKATSNKDKSKNKNINMNGNGTQTLKKASSIPKIITDSEIEEVERRRDSGAYYSWSSVDVDLYGNRRNYHNQVNSTAPAAATNDDGGTTNTNGQYNNDRFSSLDRKPNRSSSDHYWNNKQGHNNANGNGSGYDYDDNRRELATTTTNGTNNTNSNTNTNSLRKSVTLGRPPHKVNGSTNTSSAATTTKTSYYPTSAMSLDRRLLHRKPTPKIIVTDDDNEYYSSSNAKKTGSIFGNKNQVPSDGTKVANGGSKKWKFGLKSKRSNSSANNENKLRYFGDTDVEELHQNRHRGNGGILGGQGMRANQKIVFNGNVNGASSNGKFLSPSAASNSGSYQKNHDGALRTAKFNKFNTTLIPGTSSATESEMELQTGTSQKSSNAATVFLHAATIAEIPPASPVPLHQRAMSRDELSTTYSGTGSQKETHQLARSMSVLAPWRPRHYREAYEINYNSSDGVRSDYSKKPPKPYQYSLANRSTSSTSISPTDYGSKNRNNDNNLGNGNSASHWRKTKTNGSINSSDSLRLPKNHPQRISSPSLLLPPRKTQPSSSQINNGSKKSVTLSRSKSMIDSTGGAGGGGGNRNSKGGGWLPFRRHK